MKKLYAATCLVVMGSGFVSGQDVLDVLPDGMKEYSPSRQSQRLVILFDRPNMRWVDINYDDHYTNAKTDFNPNRQFPYAVNGGMENVKASDYKSIKMTNLKGTNDVQKWMASLSAHGTSTLIPGWEWRYPDGTVFADVLLNTKANKVFEVRLREKVKGQWQSNIPFEDESLRPVGYKGITGKTCNKCHQDAGSSQQYGITVRGKDTVFSYHPW